MNRIAEYRSKTGLSQEAFAKECGWGRSRIGNYETAYRHPNLDDCRVIVMALRKLGVKRVTIDDVFPPKAPETKAA